MNNRNTGVRIHQSPQRNVIEKDSDILGPESFIHPVITVTARDAEHIILTAAFRCIITSNGNLTLLLGFPFMAAKCHVSNGMMWKLNNLKTRGMLPHRNKPK